VTDQIGHNMTEYVINNFEHLNELTFQYKVKRDVWEKTDPLFKEDIDKQYEDIVKATICTDISKNLACSYEDVIVFYEENNLKTLFG